MLRGKHFTLLEEPLKRILFYLKNFYPQTNAQGGYILMMYVAMASYLQ